MSGGYVARKISRESSRNLVAEIAARKLQQLRATSRQNSTDVGIVEFVPKLSGHLEAPRWFQPYAGLLEQGAAHAANDKDPGDPLRVVLAAPPQHGKTELTLHALVWIALRYPGLRHAYVTYNQERAEYVSRKFQELALEAGLAPEGNLSDVRLKGGTEIRFTSIGGSFTGFTVDGVLVIDDPFKDRVSAESSRLRKRVQEWFSDVARSRRAPRTAIIVMATRWHEDDLSGHLVKAKGYRYVNFKAIAEGVVNDNGAVEGDPNNRAPGEALWPHVKPPEFFSEERADAYTWASLYQGEPRPRGGKVFREPGLYTKLPEKGYRGAFGLDLAYSAKTHADWSVCIEGWWCDGFLYVVDVQRKQVDAPSFALTLKAKAAQKPGWKMRWYAAGTEKGSADFLKKQGIPVKALTPKGDKFVRSIDTAAAWNSEKILLPDPEHINASWLPAFLDIVQNFTGVNDVHDDDVDALTALFDELSKPEKDLSIGTAKSSRGWG